MSSLIGCAEEDDAVLEQLGERVDAPDAVRRALLPLRDEVLRAGRGLLVQRQLERVVHGGASEDVGGVWRGWSLIRNPSGRLLLPPADLGGLLDDVVDEAVLLGLRRR